jgi:CubicO group peptidase (beta-lactamase class C family)
VERRFAWASVTKLATAVAMLVAAEEGLVDLDEPAGPPGSTLRHLLAHASGLPFDPGAPIARPGPADLLELRLRRRGRACRASAPRCRSPSTSRGLGERTALARPAGAGA